MCPISPDRDTVGIMKDGAFAQFCKVPADQVYKLPKDISLKQGKTADLPSVWLRVFRSVPRYK